MDPFRSMLNLVEGKREYMIDPDHVTKEEFEAAAVIADVLWGHEGLAEMLGSTWRMVHDPRFLRIEACGIYEQRNIFSSGAKKIGRITVKSGDLFGNHGGSVEDMTIYSEILGEGRHFLKIVQEKGWDPKEPLTEDRIWELIKQECPQYQRRDGSWNRVGETLADLFRAGLVSLVHDYATEAYCTDWIRLDTEEVVEPGKRVMVKDEDGVEVEDDVPVIAVEVDSLYKALTLRAQVRMTAYKLLKTFPGIKAADLDNLTFTDLESDAICQTLFTTAFDKLYTAIPKILTTVKAAQARSYEERVAEETARLSKESREFNAKLQSGEVERIVTEIKEAAEGDPAVFMAQLMNNPYYAGLFQGLQALEARGNEEAKTLCLELVETKGAGDVWSRVAAMVEGNPDSGIGEIQLKQAAAAQGIAWKEQSPAQALVLGKNVNPTTTEVEGVFEGKTEQNFHFVYLNPNSDPRGHFTAIVDLPDGEGFKRRTWSINPADYRALQAHGIKDVTSVPWVRKVDHSTGTTSYEPIGATQEA